MTRNGPTNFENIPAFKKTPITEALTEVFGSESMKLLEMHNFPKFEPSVEGVMSHAVQGYYAVGIAANEQYFKEEALG